MVSNKKSKGVSDDYGRRPRRTGAGIGLHIGEGDMSEPNTAEYRRFRDKRNNWINKLTGEDRNSIKSQINSMVWNATVFRIVNEARRLAENQDGKTELCGIVHILINDGFAAIQMLGTRCLLDMSKGANSLVRLLRDIQNSRSLITREHMLAEEKLPYDYELIREMHHEYAREERERTGQSTINIPRHLAWHRIKRRHEVIDKLTSVSENQRSPNDSISPDLLSCLENKVKQAGEEIVKYAHHFLAHAIGPDKRAEANADKIRVSWRDLLDGHKAFYQVANFISIYLLGWNSLGGLPIPQFDQFKYIDRPLALKEDIRVLKDTWKEYEGEINEWGLWNANDLIDEMKES